MTKIRSKKVGMMIPESDLIQASKIQDDKYLTVWKFQDSYIIQFCEIIFRDPGVLKVPSFVVLRL